jgi:hypothetical protein
VVFSLQVERVFPRKSLCSCACYLFLHPTGFRNKVFIPDKWYQSFGLSGSDDRRRRQELRSLMAQTLGIGRCRLKIMFGISLLQAYTSMTMKKKKMVLVKEGLL